MKTKEYIYVGWYIDVLNNFILKIGTTKDLERRRKEHNRNYRKAKKYTMAEDSEFTYVWSLPLSKYNTLRYEDKTRERWQNEEVGLYIRNDRFVCKERPSKVTVIIKKEYEIYF